MNTEREKRTYMLQVRITPTQQRLLEREALESADHLSVSQVARTIINKHLQKQTQNHLQAVA